ncbi:MAG: serine--tRNA ligase [Paracoccaceae bacterium]|nr:serine--tRNA ligase [Paracoccaceae bacterium]
MHDIKKIREFPTELDEKLAKRNIPAVSSLILKLDKEKRKLIQSVEDVQSHLNTLAKEFGKKKSAGKSLNIANYKDQILIKKEEIQSLESAIKTVSAKLDSILYTLPNSPEQNIPIGETEKENLEINKWGECPEFSFSAREHFEVPAASGLDFKTSSKISGSRFTILSSGIATLHRALSQFMVDTHIREHQLKEVSTPVLVREQAMLGTGQLPKFANDSYKTENGWWLIPTAEVSLTNLKAGTITPYEKLPERVCAVTQCFRSEAGSAGKDTTGMLRQHQFEKVEMVTFSPPDKSAAELERMVECAENILKKLVLPYRKILLCTGDLGFSARKTYDLEVWLPGQKLYREISSVSNCGDFQARRMNARFREKPESKPDFLHTLNGSGLAVGRCLIAVIENYQTDTGKVKIPECLKNYLSNATFLNEQGELE